MQDAHHCTDVKESAKAAMLRRPLSVIGSIGPWNFDDDFHPADRTLRSPGQHRGDQTQRLHPVLGPVQNKAQWEIVDRLVTAYLIDDQEHIFLKTVIPRRKAIKDYLRRPD